MGDIATKILPSVQVVIPVHNEQEYISDCLRSLQQLDYPSELLDILVVDNGSTDDTRRLVAGQGIECIEAPDILVGGVRNLGASRSSSEIIVFVDGDCTVATGWLKRGLETLRSYDADVIGGEGLLRENPSWVERAWVLREPSDESPQAARILQGCAILTSRNAFEAVGGFDETITAGEDTLLFETLKASGFTVIFDPQFYVVHLGYKVTLYEYIRCELWHASDYLRSNKGLLTDLTYLGTWAFTLLSLAILLCWPWSWPVALKLAGFWALLPLVLSIKRIKQANWPRLSVLRIIQIYVIDICYLTGRSLGLLKSIWSSVRSPSTGP